MKICTDKFLKNAGVKCLPFVGGEYQKNGPGGLRVLILGESHYNDNGEFGPQFTREVMEDILNGVTDPHYAIYTKIATLFSRNLTDRLGHRARFFKTVAFYNFIQSAVSGPRVPPTAEMWKAARGPFEAVLGCLKPELVLVLGVKLWKEIKIPRKKLPPVKLGNGKEAPMGYYTIDRHRCQFFRINHPSSRGFCYDVWRPALKAAIKRASAAKGKS
jgi:hypothetical protein